MFGACQLFRGLEQVCPCFPVVNPQAFRLLQKLASVDVTAAATNDSLRNPAKSATGVCLRRTGSRGMWSNCPNTSSYMLSDA